MINTHNISLTAIELKMSKTLYCLLHNKHKGCNNKIKTVLIVQHLKERGHITASGVKVRKITNWLRSEGHAPICSDSRGYWWSVSIKEIEQQQGRMKHRSNEILKAANGLGFYLRRINQLKIAA